MSRLCCWNIYTETYNHFNPMRHTLLTILWGICLSTYGYSQTKGRELNISHLTGDFYIFTTYKTFQGNPVSANGMYLVTTKGIVMIDTPWDTSQFQPLLDSIKLRHKKNVVMCLATHSHEDRTGGFDYYRKQSINTFTSRQTDEISKQRGEKRAEFLFSKDTVFTVGQYTFQTYFAGPGHTPDNIVVWFEKDKILYGGCLVKSTEAENLGYTGDANIKEWPATIQKIQMKFKNPKYIIPGHQDWKSGKSLEHTLILLKENKKKK
jgi:metallo-beta-lactamase class B